MENYENKLAVITGSTGGIGGEMAKLLADRGWDLVLLNRSAKKGEAQVHALRAAYPLRTIETVTADLLDLAQVERAVQEIAAAHPRIDALYNNSGVLTNERVMSPGGVESHFAINVLAPYRLTLGLSDALAASAEAGGSPMVVNISSGVANMAKKVEVASLPNPDEIGKLTGAYANSKLAVSAVSLFMKDELKTRGVKIRAIEPGGVKTKLTMDNASSLLWWVKIISPFIFKDAKTQTRKIVDAADPAALSGASGVVVGNGKVLKVPPMVANETFQAELRALLDSVSAPQSPT